MSTLEPNELQHALSVPWCLGEQILANLGDDLQKSCLSALQFVVFG